MARLIHVSEFNHGLDPRFYFPDARWDGTGATARSGYVYSIESGFPLMVAVHHKEVKGRLDLLVAIREWIETTLTQAVITDDLDLNYSYCWNLDRPPSERRATTVSHGYLRFHFCKAEDCTLFALSFSDIASTVEMKHPDYPPPSNLYGELTDIFGRPLYLSDAS
jgi:hypothetical protein